MMIASAFAERKHSRAHATPGKFNNVSLQALDISSGHTALCRQYQQPSRARMPESTHVYMPYIRQLAKIAL